MKGEDKLTKFNRSNVPDFAYMGEGGLVTFSYSLTQTELLPEHVTLIKQAYKESISASLNVIEWKSHKNVKINGKDWVELIYVIEESRGRMQTEMYITSVKNKLALCIYTIEDPFLKAGVLSLTKWFKQCHFANRVVVSN